MLHGHQKKVLALFVLGAIKAESIVVQRVAEELLEVSEAKAASIERRLERFLSNERIEVEAIWDHFLAQVLPSFGQQALTLILDITPSGTSALRLILDEGDNLLYADALVVFLPQETDKRRAVFQICDREWAGPDTDLPASEDQEAIFLWWD